MLPVTQYAKSGDVHIAYQAFGDGPINLVMVPGFVSNVENYWDQPEYALAMVLGVVGRPGGAGGGVKGFAPRPAHAAAFRRGGALTGGPGATPAAVTALMRMNSQIDISAILPAVRVPTLVILRTGDKTVNVEGGRDVAAHIPGARLVEFPGEDHIYYAGDNADESADAIEEILTGS